MWIQNPNAGVEKSTNLFIQYVLLKSGIYHYKSRESIDLNFHIIGNSYEMLQFKWAV